MRVVGFSACMMAAFSCAEKAGGNQVLFAPEYAWFWLVLAAVWGLWAAAFVFAKRW